MKLNRIRWAVRGVLALGVAASIAGNVLHAHDNAVSRVISAWSPLALLMTIELIARVPVHRKALAFARWAATALIAGIAAWVSYWHMAAVAGRYGETGASPYLIPLSVDGLVVVASICLVELGARIRDVVPQPAPADEQMNSSSVSTPVLVGPVFDHDRPIGPESSPAVTDNVSDTKPVVRKRPPSSEARVVAAHRRTPKATDEELAARLKVSKKTVERHRPVKVSDNLSDNEPINGREPELEAAL
jgi:hypothetical protein